MKRKVASMGDSKKADDNIQMKEFVTGGTDNKLHNDIKKKATQAKKAYAKKVGENQVRELLANKPLVALIAYVVMAIAMIAIGTLACKVGIVPVCLIVIIETLLAVCLHNLPVWLHGIVAVAVIVVGALTGQLVFTLLCAVLYVAAIMALMFIMEQQNQ